jgi:uncharacterized cupin superfamily protein
MSAYPVALNAAEVAPRAHKSNYPEAFQNRVGGRIKRPLGDCFGLTIFGVNLTTLKPGAMSALRHAHMRQDEFVYILEGTPVLVTEEGETELAPGICAGFRFGTGNAHHLINRSGGDVVYLEVGDRSAGDAAYYPDDDLVAVVSIDGKSRAFLHKDGTPY